MTTDYTQFIDQKRVTLPPTGFSVNRDSLNTQLFEFQKDIVRWALSRGRAAIFAGTGLGKALDSDTKIITPTGMQRIGDLKPGDSVIGANGKPTQVLGVYPQGTRPAYRITFSDDSTIVCDDEHLWTVRTKKQKLNGQGWQVKTLREIREEGIGASGEGRYNRWFIPMVQPVEFQESDLPLHPYLLGCLLGDGHIKRGDPSISSADIDLIEHLREIVPLGIEIVKRRYSKYDYNFVRGGRLAGMQGGHYANPIVELLTELGVQGHGAESKFIPDCYKYASAETRLLVLQGLMDTDGSVTESHGTSVLEYCTVSPRLAEDFLFLVQSLGGRGRIRTKQTNCRLAYRITPALPQGVVPFRLKRKADAFKHRTKYMPARSIRSIEYVDERDMTCIKVAAEDELFVVEGFIVTHNTRMQIEWAMNVHQLTGGDVLLLAPLAVASQTVREAAILGYDVHLCLGQEDVQPGLNIANYEMLHHFEPLLFMGVVLDESSILKSFTGKTRTEIIEAFECTPYKLACTATPAPNDYMEIGNHAEFLGVMGRSEMLSMYFVHDGGRTSNWRLKGHAEDSFWRWVASWSVVLEKPSDLGYADEGYLLPPLNVKDIIVDVDGAPANTLSERLKARRETVEARVAACADIVNASDDPFLVWCDLNIESELLTQSIVGAIEVKGSDKPAHKEQAMLDFAAGKLPVLVTKAKIAGFGMNWQRCANMAFVGLSDSFEQVFQAIRRCYRFGQTEPVNVYMVTSSREGATADNIKRKEQDFKAMVTEMVKHTQSILSESIRAADRDVTEYVAKLPIMIPDWLRSETIAS